ncbi:hypothetical protein [Streptomyces sp. NPDC029003]|uniref:hypothetical protein n=1 Tax=Streptomyces sp. NPDC029003 TaxID=3155125 RepID=UPI0033FB1D6A
MQVRPAALDDVPELIRLRAVALDSLGTDPGPADAPWRAAADGWFRERLSGRADVRCLVVGGRGHGRRIVDGLVEWLGGLGVHLVQLHASADGEPVYRAAGFTAARYPGMDLVIGPDA